MKLCHTPDTCSLAGHVSLAEAGLACELDTLTWARKFGVAAAGLLEHYFDRLGQTDAVANALATEAA